MSEDRGQQSGGTLPNSLWAATAPALPVQSPLRGAARCDVAIVGAGFTGLRTAIDVAASGASVIVLEAKDVGFGASGRSGGQVNPLLHLTPDATRAAIGERHGNRLIELTLRSGLDLFDDIDRFGIECDAVRKGWLQVAPTPRRMTVLEQLHKAWTAEGGQITLLDRQATREWSGAVGYEGGLFHPNAGHVQPLSLTRGFAKTALRYGAAIHEHSPVVGVERQGNSWLLRTPEGQVTAERVVLTTNGYTDALWPRLQREILPMVSVLAATAPLTEAQRAQILPRETSLADNRRSIIYCRYTREGRLAIGCLGSDPERPDFLGAFHRMKAGAERVFPVLRDVAWHYRWGGRIAVTGNFLPRLHEPAPGVFIGLGFNGRGVAMSSVMGRALAARLLGGSAADAPFPATAITPRPFHRIMAGVLPLAAPMLILADRLEDRR